MIDYSGRVQKYARENCTPYTNTNLCTLESFALTFLLGLNPKYMIHYMIYKKSLHNHWDTVTK